MSGSRLAELVERGRKDPTAIAALRAEGDALAFEADAPTAFAWRIAVLNALILAPPDDDAVREYYGELCDRYRDEPELLQQLRPLGEQIRRLEAEGALPSTLVARSDRRRKS